MRGDSADGMAESHGFLLRRWKVFVHGRCLWDKSMVLDVPVHHMYMCLSSSIPLLDKEYTEKNFVCIIGVLNTKENISKAKSGLLSLQ